MKYGLQAPKTHIWTYENRVGVPYTVRSFIIYDNDVTLTLTENRTYLGPFSLNFKFYLTYPIVFYTQGRRLNWLAIFISYSFLDTVETGSL